MKKRLDVLLVERGLAQSRAQAQALVMAGLVPGYDKPGHQVAEDAELSVKQGPAYVSRGGTKLANALDALGVDPAGLDAIDVGASTGGFTDVLLQRGAAKVFAIDVGTNQLAWKLRQDPRVVVHEGVNARYLTRAGIPEPIDLITCDASFIGLATVLPAPLALAAANAELIALVKPQFEAGRERVGKGGVVRDAAVQREVCERAAAWVAAQPGWAVIGIVESPILGPEGNREFLLYARLGI